MQTMTISVIILGILGLVIGVLLGVAGKIFAVETDERVEKVRGFLPGNNCGGCGYAGCDALAEAIVKGMAPVNACPVGGPKIAEVIGEIMGKEAEASDPLVAFVRCAGTCEKVKKQYEYVGAPDCTQAAVVPGKGDRSCDFGCMGFGSCVTVCEFDAIHIQKGVAVVDPSKCVACGKCVEICPNHLIVLEPMRKRPVYQVQCVNPGKGKSVLAVCDAGCIGCGICEKQCKFGAIEMVDQLPVIDPEKCMGCGACAKKCPKQVLAKRAGVK